MKLTYRGITYDYNPPWVVYGSTYAKGRYRGVPVNFQSLDVPVVQSSYTLKYRGVDYCTGIPTQAEEPERTANIIPEKVQAVALSEQSRALMAGHRQLIRQREQAMLTRLDEEIGVDTDKAAHYESHIQGKSRHSFVEGYDRSKAAMS